eukprot:6770892-Prymnesium_polylepis.1
MHPKGVGASQDATYIQKAACAEKGVRLRCPVSYSTLPLVRNHLPWYRGWTNQRGRGLSLAAAIRLDALPSLTMFDVEYTHKWASSARRSACTHWRRQARRY